MSWWRGRSESETPIGPDPDEAASGFWRRWYEVLPALSVALGEGQVGDAEDLVAVLAAELHPDLRCSVESGSAASYALVLTAAGDPALRPLTDAWLRAAPPADAIWEYHDSVPPVPDPTEVTLHLGDRPVPLAQVRVGVHVDDDAGLADLVVHHPAFAELDMDTTEAVVFVAVDATLGERLAADRLRRVRPSDTEPADAVDLLGLRSLVRRLADR